MMNSQPQFNKSDSEPEFLDEFLNHFLSDKDKVLKWNDIVNSTIFQEAIMLLCSRYIACAELSNNFNSMAAERLEASGVKTAINFLTQILTKKTKHQSKPVPEPSYKENSVYVNTNTTTNK